MSRWEPHAAERLGLAAVELFAERGYDNVTVVEIAERAGLTRRTFFRHFTDKREILFRGQDAYREMFATAIASAPTGASPLEAIGVALTAFAAGFDQDRREFLAMRQAVINDNHDLRERDLLKTNTLTAAMATALTDRGVEPFAAKLAANIGALALGDAFNEWLQPTNRESMAILAEQALRRLCRAAAELS
ncbi:TetR family transcriptional regulator [Mycolicibacterium litorale]|nr:TetR family transcriptional regulator [Mycolicibacterium litorale]